MMRKRKGYPVYPLTAAQKFHFFYQNFCPKKEVVNIGTSLTIQVDLDWNVLRESIYKAYERCDSMRLRFALDKGQKGKIPPCRIGYLISVSNRDTNKSRVPNTFWTPSRTQQLTGCRYYH